MARFRKFLVGGIIGAGVALLLSRKEVRRRLMGARRMLPAGQPPEAGMGPAAAPAAGEDLEARIEETKRQVEARLEEPYAEVAAVEVVEETPAGTLVEEEVEVVEVVEEIAPVEEVAAPEEEAAPVPPPAEEEAPAAEVVEEEVASAVEEAPAAEEEISSLGIPVEGEPTIEEPAAEAVPEVTAEAVGEAAAPEEAEAVPVEPPVPETSPPQPEQEAPMPEPSGIDREEMKRRIDETRARLKAKAFDAMVSGETFVTPETGEPIRAEEPEVEIDEETGEQIDRSLKEQD